MTDVLLVSLGSTGGLRRADDAFVESLERAGLSVRVARTVPAPSVRTFALTDLVWALAARRAAKAGIEEWDPKVVVYSSVGAALLWPRAGAIRYDALMADNRPGRHGIWQRAVERRRLREAPYLLPWSEVPVPVTGVAAVKEVEVVTYGANPSKKGLDRVLEAWRTARRPGESLVVTGLDGTEEEGVRYAGVLPSEEMGALLARARVFCCAPRREDYGIVQLEALAAGCQLVTTEAPGPYAALPLARELDARLVGDDLAGAIRLALDAPRPDYADRARELLAPWAPDAVDAIVRDRVVPALLGS